MGTRIRPRLDRVDQAISNAVRCAEQDTLPRLSWYNVLVSTPGTLTEDHPTWCLITAFNADQAWDLCGLRCRKAGMVLHDVKWQSYAVSAQDEFTPKQLKG